MSNPSAELTEDLVIATAVWGNWPRNRIAKGDRFTHSGRDQRGKGKEHLNRGGQAEMQPEYIRRLANMVDRNIHQPYHFICFADDPAKVPSGIRAWTLDVSYFSRAMPRCYVVGAPDTGCPIPEGTRILTLDLDVVITGALDDMVDYEEHGETLIARERKYRLPVRDPDGDIIFSVAGSRKAGRVAEIFNQEMANQCATTDCGDDRIVMGWADAACWIDVCPGQVESFKWGRKRGFPRDVRIVSFHGKPLPDQAQAPWVRQYWK